MKSQLQQCKVAIICFVFVKLLVIKNWKQSFTQYFSKLNRDQNPMQSKTVYLEKDQNKTSQVYTLIAPRLEQLVDIKPILTSVPDWEQKFFKIYNPQQDGYISLQKICKEKFLVPREYLQLNIVMIKYYQEQCKSEQQMQSEQNKKQRSRERSIRQVVQLVQRWRDMHTPSSTAQGKKLNLQQAAKIIGISKKSLDDYFFQLRMGEKYGFDFSKCLDCKIGMLRTFVKQKQNESKKSGKQKTSKHPKKLKLIQQFARKLHIKQSNQSQKQSEEIINEAVQIQKQKLEFGFNLGKLVDSQQLFWGSPFSPIQDKQFMDCQNNFFKDFQNLMEDGNDPFMPFANFNKSKSIFGDDQNSCSNLGF